MIKLFLWNFRRFMRFIRIFFKKFFWPIFLPDRLWRSTDWSTGPQSRSTSVDRRAQACAHLARHMGRSTGRSTGPKSSALCFSTVDRPVDRGLPTVKNMTVGGRPPTVSGCKNNPTAIFWRGLFKPHFFEILVRFFRAKNSYSLVFIPASFQKVFGA